MKTVNLEGTWVKAFLMAAPQLWSNLPGEMCLAFSFRSLKGSLKQLYLGEDSVIFLFLFTGWLKLLFQNVFLYTFMVIVLFTLLATLSSIRKIGN